MYFLCLKISNFIMMSGWACRSRITKRNHRLRQSW